MTMMNVEAGTLALRMRTARLIAGLEQAEIAASMGVSRNTVSNWENGRTEPSVSQFISWAELTKQPADQMIDGLPGSCARRDSNSQPSDLEFDREFWSIAKRIPIPEYKTEGAEPVEADRPAPRLAVLPALGSLDDTHG